MGFQINADMQQTNDWESITFTKKEEVEQEKANESVFTFASDGMEQAAIDAGVNPNNRGDMREAKVRMIEENTNSSVLYEALGEAREKAEANPETITNEEFNNFDETKVEYDDLFFTPEQIVYTTPDKGTPKNPVTNAQITPNEGKETIDLTAFTGTPEEKAAQFYDKLEENYGLKEADISLTDKKGDLTNAGAAVMHALGIDAENKEAFSYANEVLADYPNQALESGQKELHLPPIDISLDMDHKLNEKEIKEKLNETCKDPTIVYANPTEASVDLNEASTGMDILGSVGWGSTTLKDAINNASGAQKSALESVGVNTIIQELGNNTELYAAVKADLDKGKLKPQELLTTNFAEKYADKVGDGTFNLERAAFLPVEGFPKPTPSPAPLPAPTPERIPTPVPTQEPTPVPTQEPTPVPTQEPTPKPTDRPTPEPTREPTPVPTICPTIPPIIKPEETYAPVPTVIATIPPRPTDVPTQAPPTQAPPTQAPPTQAPPTQAPSTPAPTQAPSTPAPTEEVSTCPTLPPIRKDDEPATQEEVSTCPTLPPIRKDDEPATFDETTYYPSDDNTEFYNEEDYFEPDDSDTTGKLFRKFKFILKKG